MYTHSNMLFPTQPHFRIREYLIMMSIHDDTFEGRRRHKTSPVRQGLKGVRDDFDEIA